MTGNNLLGHLALRLGTHEELWATEALYFILQSSSAARQALLEYVGEKTHVPLPVDLFFRTQVVANDGSIPDLVAIDADHHTRLVVEAKFWAGLTDNQPITYLQHMAPNMASVLLFIAPAARLQTLWPEVLGRCQQANMVIKGVFDQAEPFVAQVAGRTLSLISWRTLLIFLVHRLEVKGELATAADVRQLIGLCEQMDQVAFLPVRSQELSPQIGRRLSQYCDLVDDLTEQLKQEHIASVKGLRATATKSWYGRYMKVYERYDCILKFDYVLWGNLRETPLWFRVWNYQDAKQRLLPLEMETPPAVLHLEDELLVPLLVPISVERSVVFNSLLAQIKRVTKLLEPASV